MHDLLQTSSRGCHEDATRKLLPWNLSYSGVVTILLSRNARRVDVDDSSNFYVSTQLGRGGGGDGVMSFVPDDLLTFSIFHGHVYKHGHKPASAPILSQPYTSQRPSRRASHTLS